MSYLKVYKEDLKRLVVFAAILPVACFAGGYLLGAKESIIAEIASTGLKPVLKQKEVAQTQVVHPNTSLIETSISETAKIVASPVEKVSLPGKAAGEQESDKALADDFRVAKTESTEVIAKEELEEAITSEEEAEATNELNLLEKESAVKLVKVDSSLVKKPQHLSSQIKQPKPASELFSGLHEFDDYLVQAGRFTNLSNAIKYQKKLTDKRLDAKIALETTEKGDIFVLVLASFDSQSEAKDYTSLVEELYQIDLFVHKQTPLTKSKVNSIASI